MAGAPAAAKVAAEFLLHIIFKMGLQYDLEAFVKLLEAD